MAWGVPVSELEGLSADELLGYAAYLGFEPTGSAADDVRTAIIAHTIACCHSTNPPSLAELLPRWEPRRQVGYREGARAFAAYLAAI